MRLAASAVLDADPDDVMPPVPGPPGWTADRLAAFVAFHRGRRGGLEGPHAEVSSVVLVAGAPAGVVRLQAVAPETLEVGLWLARSVRGRGVGGAVLRAAARQAAALGARTLVAETTSDNVAALGALRRVGAQVAGPDPDGVVRAELMLRE